MKIIDRAKELYKEEKERENELEQQRKRIANLQINEPKKQQSLKKVEKRMNFAKG